MIHHDWTQAEVREILDRPFHDLLADAHRVHSDRFDPDEIEGASLVSIKTGGCSEDCAYCPQSARYQTGLEAQALLSTEEIVAAARDAKAVGATQFCMGAAWRSPTDKQVDAVVAAVREVAALELQRPARRSACSPQRRPRRWPPPVSTTTTTTWTPHLSSTVRSSPPARMTTGWPPSQTSGLPG